MHRREGPQPGGPRPACAPHPEGGAEAWAWNRTSGTPPSRWGLWSRPGCFLSPCVTGPGSPGSPRSRHLLFQGEKGGNSCCARPAALVGWEHPQRLGMGAQVSAGLEVQRRRPLSPAHTPQRPPRRPHPAAQALCLSQVPTDASLILTAGLGPQPLQGTCVHLALGDSDRHCTGPGFSPPPPWLHLDTQPTVACQTETAVPPLEHPWCSPRDLERMCPRRWASGGSTSVGWVSLQPIFSAASQDVWPVCSVDTVSRVSGPMVAVVSAESGLGKAGHIKAAGPVSPAGHLLPACQVPWAGQGCSCVTSGHQSGGLQGLSSQGAGEVALALQSQQVSTCPVVCAQCSPSHGHRSGALASGVTRAVTGGRRSSHRAQKNEGQGRVHVCVGGTEAHPQMPGPGGAGQRLGWCPLPHTRGAAALRLVLCGPGMRGVLPMVRWALSAGLRVHHVC